LGKDYPCLEFIKEGREKSIALKKEHKRERSLPGEAEKKISEALEREIKGRY